MKNCWILGKNSDIFKGIEPLMRKDGFRFEGSERWEVCLITIGRVAPVGNWWDLEQGAFESCINSNLIEPWKCLHSIWQDRAPNATVIWFSGSNPQGIMDGYAPYNCSKMAVNKLVEQLDHETPDAKFIAFGPGYVRDSKIHKPTLEKGWPNPRIARGDAGNSMESIWEAIKWCIEQNKSLVGGKNICVSDVPFTEADDAKFKLRRMP